MNSQSCSRLVYGKDDALFGSIERQQGDQPFGVVLDAGTGLHSLRWLATLKLDEEGENPWVDPNTEDGTVRRSKGMERCVAVTADEAMKKNCQRELEALGADSFIDVVVGNWFSDKYPIENQLGGFVTASDPEHPEELFDVILADYLIGAMDGFSPYRQDLMIPKLARFLKPGGRLYIVGLQPLPQSVPNDPDATAICRVRQIRDACILLAGHACYREYPVDWVQRQIAKLSYSLRLVNTSTFDILYRQETIVKQINVARSKLPFFPSSELAAEMEKTLDQLEQQTEKAVQNRGRISLGFDYVVTAEKF